MSNFRYPTSDYDRPQTLLSLLGTHWESVYAARDRIASYVGRVAQLEAQTHLDLLETIAVLSRAQVPLFHRENWYLLPLTESALTERPLTYGAGATYNAQYRYGQSLPSWTWEVELPADLVTAPLMLSSPAGARLTWTQGIDYRVDREQNKIVFRANPFAQDELAIHPVYDGDTVVDRETALWIFRGEFDWQYAYQHWGYLLQLQMESSQGYKDLLNAVFDGLAGGTSRAVLEAAFSALTGVVLCQEAGTVEFVGEDRQRLVIATEQRLYRYHRSSTPLVAVGDAVVAGQPLVDALQFFDLTAGEVPAGIDSLQLEDGLLGEGYLAGLTFENTTTPLVVEEDVEGYTKVSFALGGFAADAEAFWDEVHRRGVAAGTTLAHLLDIRETPVGEPTAASLPATINPLQFLIANVLRYQTLLAKIRVQAQLAPADVRQARVLRRLVPPWMAVITICELEVADDPITMDGPGDAEHPGYQETAALLDGFETAEETITADTYLRESARLGYVDGFCE